LMCADAVVCLSSELSSAVKYIRIQAGQLASKMRFVAIQLQAYLENDLWLKNAQHANKMALLLAQKLGELPSISCTRPVVANGVFVRIPPQYIPQIHKKFFFYCFNEQTSEYRLMTAFDTTEDHIMQLVSFIKEIVS